MKKILFLTSLLALVFTMSLVSCDKDDEDGGSGVKLSPPAWIQGKWEAVGIGSGDYYYTMEELYNGDAIGITLSEDISIEFTSNNIRLTTKVIVGSTSSSSTMDFGGTYSSVAGLSYNAEETKTDTEYKIKVTQTYDVSSYQGSTEIVYEFTKESNNTIKYLPLGSTSIYYLLEKQ